MKGKQTHKIRTENLSIPNGKKVVTRNLEKGILFHEEDIFKNCIIGHPIIERETIEKDGYKFRADGTVEILENNNYRIASEEEKEMLAITHGEYFGGGEPIRKIRWVDSNGHEWTEE